MVTLQCLSLFLLLLECHSANPRPVYLPDINDHTFSDLTEYKVHHYAINITVNMDVQQATRRTPRISGTVVVNYRRLKRKISAFRLDTISLKIKGVYLLNNEGGVIRRLKSRFDTEDKILGQALSIKMANTPEQGRILIKFSSWLNGLGIYYHNSRRTGHYMYLLAQPISARAWFPCQDTNRAKATVSLNITVDKPFTAVAAGQHLVTEDGNTTRSFHYYVTIPISPYLIGIVVGNLDFVDITSEIRVWYQTDSKTKRESEAKELGYIARALFPDIKHLLGSYVWGRYDMVIIPMFIGGMEIPNINYIKTDLSGYLETFTVAHEMIHSWIGNLITARYSSDLWINEGLTMYVCTEEIVAQKMLSYHNYTLEEFYNLAIAYTKISVESNISMLNPNLTNIDPREYLLSYVPYFKAMFFIKDLELKVGGRNKMNEFIRLLLSKYAYRNVGTVDFIETFTETFPSVSVPWKEWMHNPENTGKLEDKVFEKLSSIEFGDVGSGIV